MDELRDLLAKQRVQLMLEQYSFTHVTLKYRYEQYFNPRKREYRYLDLQTGKIQLVPGE